MTGIVYTDEGGQEQSLLGKLVYTTDESGSSNIILQVVSSRTLKLQIDFAIRIDLFLYNFEYLDNYVF